jgi:hypothetical protein
MIITELYAFIAENESGKEGVMAWLTPEGVWLPMIGADMERVDSMRKIADAIAATSDTTYEVRKFVVKEDA